VRQEGGLQHAFPLDVLMVPSSSLTVAADGERLSCDVFSLGETIRFGRLEFIADRFSVLSLSPMGDGSGATIMGSTCGVTPSPLRAMIGDSIKEFHTASDKEGKIDLPSLRRHDTEASTAPATTIPWLETTLTAQAMMTILLWQGVPWHEPPLGEERILTIDYALVRAQGKGEAPTASHEEGLAVAKALNASPLPTADGVDKLYLQPTEIHAVVITQLAECTRWCRFNSTRIPVQVRTTRQRPDETPSTIRMAAPPPIDFSPQASLRQ
jgi:hypothetical protein